MIVQMKIKESLKANVQQKGDEPIIEWLQNLQFRVDMITIVKEGLEKSKDKIKEEQERDFTLLRRLHTDSQTSGQRKGLVRIANMSKYFFDYVDRLADDPPTNQIE